jgi:hypothetical protein
VLVGRLSAVRVFWGEGYHSTAFLWCHSINGRARCNKVHRFHPIPPPVSALTLETLEKTDR